MENLCRKTRCDSHAAFFGSSPHPIALRHLQRIYIRIVEVYRQKFLQYTGEANTSESGSVDTPCQKCPPRRSEWPRLNSSDGYGRKRKVDSAGGCQRALCACGSRDSSRPRPKTSPPHACETRAGWPLATSLAHPHRLARSGKVCTRCVPPAAGMADCAAVLAPLGKRSQLLVLAGCGAWSAGNVAHVTQAAHIVCARLAGVGGGKSWERAGTSGGCHRRDRLLERAKTLYSISNGSVAASCHQVPRGVD